MLKTATFFELRRSSRAGIVAVPHRGGRPGKAVRLPDGAIVEAPTPDQRCDVPEHPNGHLEVGHGGVPATCHHRNLGLITGFAPLAGVFVLSSGEVAAVYGARAEPIG